MKYKPSEVGATRSLSKNPHFLQNPIPTQPHAKTKPYCSWVRHENVFFTPTVKAQCNMQYSINQCTKEISEEL